MKYPDNFVNQVIQGDCLDILLLIPDKSVDCIIQDAPYNTTACAFEWDIMTKIEEFWQQWKRIIKDSGAIVMFGSQPFTSKLIMSNLKMFRYEWIWEKSTGGGFLNANKTPLKRHENILIFSSSQMNYNPQKTFAPKYTHRRASVGVFYGEKNKDKAGWVTQNKGDRYPTSILKFSNETGLHPTQKPVALLEYLLKTYTNEGDIVFDGFYGSGTTGVAAKKLGRNFIGVELNPDYCKIAQDRIAKTEVNGQLELELNC